MLFNFSWIRDGELAGMAYPDAAAWPLLAEEGIGAVVSLTGRSPPGDPEAAGLDLLHAPIPDFGIPSDADLRHTLRFIKKHIEDGCGVVVHCRAGQGRTGLVLAAYLVYEGMSATDAIDRVRTLRPGSIETREQLELVKRLARAQRLRRRARDEEQA